MNSRLTSLICLLGIIAAVSLMATEAQENESLELNKISQQNGTSGNISLNLSDTNNASINETSFNKSLLQNKDTFTITSNVTAKPMNGVGYNVCANNPGVQSLKKPVFQISGYTRPAAGVVYQDTSLLNAAYLSRGVEGTPHGYVTYHN